MRTDFLFLISFLILLSPRQGISISRSNGVEQGTATLYSANKYPKERRDFCFNFESGPSQARSGSCDLRYGYLYVGDELDWFESSAAQNDRSVIRDLGSHRWLDDFEVRRIEPLPRLKPGEQRSFTVDASGADGADGAPGAPGGRGEQGAVADGVVQAERTQMLDTEPPTQPTAPSRPKRDGRPKVSSLWVKAIAGHMYVIHVVNETRDFYALFHVEDVKRGDNCTISWRLMPTPVNDEPSERSDGSSGNEAEKRK